MNKLLTKASTCDLTRTADVGVANRLESVDALGIFLVDLHDLSNRSFAFSITLSESNASIVRSHAERACTQW